jgi:hypothetical protein
MTKNETAQEWMDKHGLKVGDEVRVVRKDEEWESWNECMDDLIDSVGIIERSSHNAIFLDLGDDEDSWWFRPCSLEPVEKVSAVPAICDDGPTLSDGEIIVHVNGGSVTVPYQDGKRLDIAGHVVPGGVSVHVSELNEKLNEWLARNLEPDFTSRNEPSPALRKEYLDEFAKWKEGVQVGDWFEVMRVPVDGEGGWKDQHPGEVFGQFVVGEKVQVRTFFESSGNVLVDFSDNGTLDQCEFPYFVLRPCAKPESYKVTYPTLKEFLG